MTAIFESSMLSPDLALLAWLLIAAIFLIKLLSSHPLISLSSSSPKKVGTLSVIGGVLNSMKAHLSFGNFLSSHLLFLSRTISSKHVLPPTTPTFPVVGGLLKFMKKGPLHMIKEEYDRLGSVFSVKLLNRNITFLVGPQESAHFFTAPESQLSQKEVYRFTVPMFGPGVVYDVDYATRMEHVRFFNDAVKGKSLRSYVDKMVLEAQTFYSRWGDEGEVDLKNELEQLVVLIVSRCLLGREIRENLHGDVNKIFNEMVNGVLPITLLFPFLPIPPHWRRDKAREKLVEVFTKIINSRRSSGNVEDDMLQTFMDSKCKITGRPTTETEITGLLTAILFGGQNSSSTTATWLGAHLLSDKRVQEPVLQEQKEMLKRHGDKLDYDILNEMNVLFRNIKEVLRLHPPFIILLRYNHEDFCVHTREGVEYMIPKGHFVATSPGVANRLPYLYKDPDSFDPERFGPGREEDKVGGPLSHITFSGGRHTCLGEHFAYLAIKTIWSLLLRNFELEMISPFPETDYQSIVARVKGGVMVRYKRKPLLSD